jgi:hypothetical protein
MLCAGCFVVGCADYASRSLGYNASILPLNYPTRCCPLPATTAGVGLNSKVGTANFIRGLASRLGQELLCTYVLSAAACPSGVGLGYLVVCMLCAGLLGEVC